MSSDASSGLRLETRHAVWAGGLLAVGALAIALGTGLIAMPELPELDPSASFWLVFFAGLSVGGLSCVAVQGGLLATVTTRDRQTARTERNIVFMGFPVGWSTLAGPAVPSGRVRGCRSRQPAPF